MNILVRGMKMPETCFDCPFRDFEFHECSAKEHLSLQKDEYGAEVGDIPEWCPLSYVPPYTRLIDAETLYCRLVNEPIRAVDGIPFDADWWTRIADAYEQAIDAVEQAPTIIEAEEE